MKIFYCLVDKVDIQRKIVNWFNKKIRKAPQKELPMSNLIITRRKKISIKEYITASLHKSHKVIK